MALLRVDWFEILDDMQPTPKLEKSEQVTSETERSRISEESKNEARRKSQSNIRHIIGIFFTEQQS